MLGSSAGAAAGGGGATAGAGAAGAAVAAGRSGADAEPTLSRSRYFSSWYSNSLTPPSSRVLSRALSCLRAISIAFRRVSLRPRFRRRAGIIGAADRSAAPRGVRSLPSRRWPDKSGVLEVIEHGRQRQGVRGRAEAGDRADTGRRDRGPVPKRLARGRVRQVQLDGGQPGASDGVVQGVRRVRESAGIEQQAREAIVP